MGETESWFGPGETARRLGVTAKALRVYEREGLVVPRRAESGWHLYGPAQIAGLHQIVVLRDLGLSLKAIKTLVGSRSRLRDVLRLQRETLESQQDRITRAIALIETAQRQLDEGRDLSLDGRAAVRRHRGLRHTARSPDRGRGPDRPGEPRLRPDQGDVGAIRANRGDAHKARLKAMMAEAGRLTEAGDVNSEAAKAFVRRMRSCTAAITRPAQAEQELIRNAYAKTVAEAQARSEPIPFDPAIGEFLRQVALGMKERGELD
jgi:MerR family transcriptional regulator, thiopeptide resistance regulator